MIGTLPGATLRLVARVRLNGDDFFANDFFSDSLVHILFDENSDHILRLKAQAQRLVMKEDYTMNLFPNVKNTLREISQDFDIPLHNLISQVLSFPVEVEGSPDLELPLHLLLQRVSPLRLKTSAGAKGRASEFQVPALVKELSGLIGGASSGEEIAFDISRTSDDMMFSEYENLSRSGAMEMLQDFVTAFGLVGAGTANEQLNEEDIATTTSLAPTETSKTARLPCDMLRLEQRGFTAFEWAGDIPVVYRDEDFLEFSSANVFDILKILAENCVEDMGEAFGSSRG